MERGNPRHLSPTENRRIKFLGDHRAPSTRALCQQIIQCVGIFILHVAVADCFGDGATGLLKQYLEKLRNWRLRSVAE